MSVVHHPVCPHMTYIPTHIHYNNNNKNVFFVILCDSRFVWAKGHEIWSFSEQHTWPLYCGDDGESNPNPQQESQGILPVCRRWVLNLHFPNVTFFIYTVNVRSLVQNHVRGDDRAVVIWLVGSWFAPCVLFSYEAESITATTTASPNWLWRKPWCSTKPSIVPHSWPESRTLYLWSRLITPTYSPLAATHPEGIPSLVMSKSSVFKTCECCRSCEAKTYTSKKAAVATIDLFHHVHPSCWLHNIWVCDYITRMLKACFLSLKVYATVFTHVKRCSRQCIFSSPQFIYLFMYLISVFQVLHQRMQMTKCLSRASCMPTVPATST